MEAMEAMEVMEANSMTDASMVQRSSSNDASVESLDPSPGTYVCIVVACSTTIYYGL